MYRLWHGPNRQNFISYFLFENGLKRKFVNHHWLSTLLQNKPLAKFKKPGMIWNRGTYQFVARINYAHVLEENASTERDREDLLVASVEGGV